MAANGKIKKRKTFILPRNLDFFFAKSYLNCLKMLICLLNVFLLLSSLNHKKNFFTKFHSLLCCLQKKEIYFNFNLFHLFLFIFPTTTTF